MRVSEALAFVFEVLRCHADGRVWKQHVVFADYGGAFQVHVRHEPGSRADLDIRADDAVGTDLGAVRDAGAASTIAVG